MTDRARRARVALIGGDAQRLRQLRLFLDGLGVFEAIAIVSGAAGVNAIGRQQWDVALLVDDLHDMPVEVFVGRARAARYRGPFVGVTLTADRNRIVALHAAEMQEILVMNAAPGPEIARALARAIERHELVSRITNLEQELARSNARDEDTGLYPTWRFDEEWRNEQARAMRRGSDMALLAITMVTERPMDQLPARDRIVLYGQASRAIRAGARPGDLAGHDGGGSFRLLLPDVGTAEALEISSKIKAAMRQEALRGGGGAELQISLESGFDEGFRRPPV